MSQNMQRHQRGNHRGLTDLKTPVRNHYFYGKLLDVFHLELEQEYFNSKRWLHNRLVTGPGVVCGLNVELDDYDKSIVVGHGFAIDRCGREIIVANPSKPYPLPEFPPYESAQTKKGSQAKQKYPQPEEEAQYRVYDVPFAHVVICYHECETDPTPAMAGDCETVAMCASGSVREQYSIEIRDGYAPKRERYFPRNIVERGRVDYRALVDYVTDSCRDLPEDCCIALANIQLVEGDYGWKPEIDNSVRPIVYTNRLLWDLISSLAYEEAEESQV